MKSYIKTAKLQCLRVLLFPPFNQQNVAPLQHMFVHMFAAYFVPLIVNVSKIPVTIFHSSKCRLKNVMPSQVFRTVTKVMESLVRELLLHYKGAEFDSTTPFTSHEIAFGLLENVIAGVPHCPKMSQIKNNSLILFVLVKVTGVANLLETYYLRIFLECLYVNIIINY